MTVGKPVGDSFPFSVIDHYDPSGFMGDIGDITVAKQRDLIRYTYATNGKGPHEWDWKYIQGTLSPLPARFSGVMLLDPPNNWGVIEDGGYDLRGIKSVSWQARCLEGQVYVEFIIGGVEWQWNDNTKNKQAVPYPDSLPRVSLGTYLLDNELKSFEYKLSDQPESYLRKVIGGFGWVISWGSNGVEINADQTGPEKSKTFVIEVMQVQYQK